MTKHLRAAALVPVLALTLGACGTFDGHGTVDVTGTAGPAGVATSTPATATTTSAATTTGTGTTGTGTASSPAGGTTGSSAKGCPANGVRIPAGSDTASTVDLDGDGKADTIWIQMKDGINVGVRTASGAGFSTNYQTGSPIAPRAAANRLSDGSAVVLLDTGRSVPLFAVDDCKLVATKNPQGQQYTFDEGFTGYGTGVGCVKISGRTRLVGWLVDASGNGGKLAVARTTINLSSGGTRAANGETINVAPSAEAVATGRDVTCGSAKWVQAPQ